MTESDISRSLCDALVSLGVHKESIFYEMDVCTGAQRPYRADILVAASDKKTPLFVFEIKRGSNLSLAYRNARRQLAGVLGMFPCFVVALNKANEVCIARIVSYELDDACWIRLDDVQGVKKLIGDYEEVSKETIARNTTDGLTKRMEQFRNGVVGSGTLIILIAYTIEMVTGKTMSYQLAAFIGLVFVLYAASYGVIKDAKLGGNQISFHIPKKEKNRESV